MSRFNFRQLPLEYASRGKRDPKAGLPFFQDNIGDDLLIILIAFAPFSPSPVAVALAIVFLHFSFWSVYEIGYYENDLVASKFERDAQIPVGFRDFEGSYSTRTAWAWAIVLGAAGIACIWWSGVSYLAGRGGIELAGLLTVWAALLGLLRIVFRHYNHIDKMTRVFVYLPLQVLKYGFPALFFALPATGAALIFAQIMRRWTPYLVYRYMKKQPLAFPARLVRLLVFAMLWLMLIPSQAGAEFFLHGAVVLAWLGLRSMSQLRVLLRDAGHVTVDEWKKDDANGVNP